MTKILKLFTAAVLVFGMSSCSGSKNEGETGSENKELTTKQKLMLKGMEHEIEKVNKELPVETVEGGYLVSTCTYEEGTELEIDDSAENKANIIEAAGESAVKRLKELGMGLKYVYVEDGTGKTQTITITPEEL